MQAAAIRVLGMKFARIFLALNAVVIASLSGSIAASQQVTPTRPVPVTSQLVIIDTDIGDDIDDAFAVGLALKSPELRILGVTTTFGDTEMRARILDRYLAAVGRSDIPVAAGPSSKTDNVMSQAAYARQAPQRKHVDGADFILKQIRLNPGKITLIAIGPLFTVQAAIERDPATFKKLERVVIMGGSVYRGYGMDSAGKPKPAEPEWNIDRNPAGARALLGAGVPVFMMPLDSTQLKLDEYKRAVLFHAGTPLTDALILLYHEWGEQTPTLYDPMTIAFIVHPQLCPVKPLRIRVDDQGFTRPETGSPNAQVCLHSDSEAFFRFYIPQVTGE